MCGDCASAAPHMRTAGRDPASAGGSASPTIRHAPCVHRETHGPPGLRDADDVLLRPPPLETPRRRTDGRGVVGAVRAELARGVAPPVGTEVRAARRAPPAPPRGA